MKKRDWKQRAKDAEELAEWAIGLVAEAGLEISDLKAEVDGLEECLEFSDNFLLDKLGEVDRLRALLDSANEATEALDEEKDNLRARVDELVRAANYWHERDCRCGTKPLYSADV